LQVIDLGGIDHTEGRNALLGVKADEAVGAHGPRLLSFRRKPLIGRKFAIRELPPALSVTGANIDIAQVVGDFCDYDSNVGRISALFVRSEIEALKLRDRKSGRVDGRPRIAKGDDSVRGTVIAIAPLLPKSN
jgi:hypothetical protein